MQHQRKVIVAAAVAIGGLMVTDMSFAASWTVGYTAGTNAGQSQSVAAPSNLTIAAVAVPVPGNLLGPGGTGDVVLKITNPNAYPISLSAITLPTNVVNAIGYTDSALTVPNVACTAALSTVNWTGATSSTVTHTLTTPLVIAKVSDTSNDPLTVTLTGMASMGSSAPVGCASTYFAMPALAGITATVPVSTATATTSPATDS